MRTNVIVFVTLVGCAPDGALFVPLPDMNSETALVAVAHERTVRYRAAASSGRLRFDLPPEGNARIAIGFFDEELDYLGLVEGPVETTIDPYARPLPPMVSGFTAEYVDGEVAEWVAVERLDPALEGFQLPPRGDLATNCAWEARPRRVLETTEFLRGTLTLDDGRLVIVFNRRIEVVDVAGNTKVYVLPTTPFTTVIGAAGDNAVFLAASDGTLFRATLLDDGTVDHQEVVAAATTRRRFNAAHRLPEGHLVTNFDGAIFRLNDAGLTSVAEIVGGFDTRVAVGRGGEVYVAIDRTIYELIADSLIPRMAVDQDVIGLFVSSDGELLAGLLSSETLHGRISRLDLDSQTKVDLHSTTQEGDLWFMIESSRGVTYVSGYEHGGDIGAAYHFVPGYGPCMGALARLEERPTGLARLGDGFAVVLGNFMPIEVIPFALP